MNVNRGFHGWTKSLSIVHLKEARLSGHADFVMEYTGTTNAPGIKQLKQDSRRLEEAVLLAWNKDTKQMNVR